MYEWSLKPLTTNESSRMELPYSRNANTNAEFLNFPNF
jgi:hypothetical protein